MEQQLLHKPEVHIRIRTEVLHFNQKRRGGYTCRIRVNARHTQHQLQHLVPSPGRGVVLVLNPPPCQEKARVGGDFLPSCSLLRCRIVVAAPH
jgi:hypothetical protein